MKYVLLSIVMYASQCKAQRQLADSIILQHSLRETVLFLSKDSLKGRLTGSVGGNIAANFIAAKFDSAGLTQPAFNQGYIDSFVVHNNGKALLAKNVMGILPGKFTNDTLVIFSAHYDHLGQKDDLPFNKDYNDQDYIFNGANDNATGVAALLALAQYYKAQNNNRYKLLFVAFSAEELGMLGSAHLVKKLNQPVIKAVINLEMLGRPEQNNCFIVSFRNNSIRNMLNNYFKRYQPSGAKKFFESDPYYDENLAERSDHYPFAKKIKNAFTIMGTAPTDKYYHTTGDEYQTINFNFLLMATRNIALACEQFTR